jgi:hypothetical protein
MLKSLCFTLLRWIVGLTLGLAIGVVFLLGLAHATEVCRFRDIVAGKCSQIPASLGQREYFMHINEGSISTVPIIDWYGHRPVLPFIPTIPLESSEKVAKAGTRPPSPIPQPAYRPDWRARLIERCRREYPPFDPAWLSDGRFDEFSCRLGGYDPSKQLGPIW